MYHMLYKRFVYMKIFSDFFYIYKQLNVDSNKNLNLLEEETKNYKTMRNITCFHKPHLKLYAESETKFPLK